MLYISIKLSFILTEVWIQAHHPQIH